MNYRTLYDGTNELPGIALPIVGALVACFCTLLWAYRGQIFSSGDQAAAPRGKRILLYFLIGSVLFTVGTAFSTYQTWRDGPRRLAEGRASVVEGLVENFRPMVTGHDTERFTVNGVHFSYSPNILGQGFNQAGGVIRPGLRVRIHYALRPCEGGCADIWKLEVAE